LSSCPWAIRSLRDVEEREEEDPDQIDEVPVDPDELDPLELAIVRASFWTHSMISAARDDVARVEPAAV
jgi:hypothetical protein